MNGEREAGLARQRLTSHGYILFEKRSIREALDICAKLGKMIRHDEVRVDPNSRSKLNSGCLLDVHTDHSKAKYIAWYCFKQSSRGGETLILDSRELLQHLNDYEIKCLREIHLFQHSVFKSDARSWPLLSSVDGTLQIYYAGWLVNPVDQHKQELRKLKRLIKLTQKNQLRLTPGDLLVIDNRRILHGRREIKGDKDRHLRRFWLA